MNKIIEKKIFFIDGMVHLLTINILLFNIFIIIASWNNRVKMKFGFIGKLKQV